MEYIIELNGINSLIYGDLSSGTSAQIETNRIRTKLVAIHGQMAGESLLESHVGYK
jgi:hypothetical protein